MTLVMPDGGNDFNDCNDGDDNHGDDGDDKPLVMVMTMVMGMSDYDDDGVDHFGYGGDSL